MSRRPSRPHIGSERDDEQLAALGHKGELNRTFSPLAMLGLAFAILNSWTALAASLSLALPSGGPTSVIWGLVAAGVCNLCLAASLAEFLSAYPTAGGQYHCKCSTFLSNEVCMFSE
jgi:choline transport protein